MTLYINREENMTDLQFMFYNLVIWKMKVDQNDGPVLIDYCRRIDGIIYDKVHQVL